MDSLAAIVPPPIEYSSLVSQNSLKAVAEFSAAAAAGAAATVVAEILKCGLAQGQLAAWRLPGVTSFSCASSSASSFSIARAFSARLSPFWKLSQPASRKLGQGEGPSGVCVIFEGSRQQVYLPPTSVQVQRSTQCQPIKYIFKIHTHICVSRIKCDTWMTPRRFVYLCVSFDCNQSCKTFKSLWGQRLCIVGPRWAQPGDCKCAKSNCTIVQLLWLFFRTHLGFGALRFCRSLDMDCRQGATITIKHRVTG